MDVLKEIKSSKNLKDLNETELDELCREIREFLINNISQTGGHLASNLGVVELMVAIHRIFETSRDRLIFDVGHQCYVHKILTGRKDRFSTLRQFGGISGFPKPGESIHDAFIAGHASNSISVGLGMARARTLSHSDYNVISLIGDGALTGGLAYEALNDAGDSGEPFIVILNDNGMAISSNVGGMARYLAHQRLKPGYLSFKKGYQKFMNKFPIRKRIYKFLHGIKSAVKEAIFHCSMFEEMGFQYLGPVDGHDIQKLEDILTLAKEYRKPVLVHVITTKGKGYTYSEQNPDEYHGVSQFNTKKGVKPSDTESFSSVFGRKMVQIAKADPSICAITAAMAAGTGLVKFASCYPERFFDVGIAEEHGAAMAAGLAKQGGTPVFAVYSTFLQRAYDMLIHDVALSHLHVVFAVDRSGLVGDDGETHHGVFDVAYLTSVPGMTVWCPASFSELEKMLEHAVFKADGPVAIRYPRGGEGKQYTGGDAQPSRLVHAGNDITIVTYGTSINTALEAAKILIEKKITPEIIKLGTINPIDYRLLDKSVLKTRKILVLEECVSRGCVGEHLLTHFAQEKIELDTVILKNLGDRFIPHGHVDELRRFCRIDAESVVEAVLEAFINE